MVDPIFHRVNRIFILSFENNTDRATFTRSYLPKVDIKYYNVMINGQNVFDQPVKTDIKISENIRKIATGKGDDFTTGFCLIIFISNKTTS